MDAVAQAAGDFSALERELRAAFSGELRSDRLARVLYATDASFYEIVPDGVAFPRSVEDVAAAVRLCAKHRVPLTARGAGTGLTGGAVNRGLQLDCSRHLKHILDIDPAARTARVEPGVVLDELNAAARPHGLQFAPDVATSSRATIGGMIANNSCGAHSILYGRTVDHVLSVDLVLADGSRCIWGAGEDSPDNVRARHCQQTLGTLTREHADEITARFPQVLRSNGGYALDRLKVAHGRVNVETIICGSEGTLGVIVGARLKLIPLPLCKGLLIVQFHELLPALEAVGPVLEHDPAAVELVDDLILSATRNNPALARRRWWVTGNPKAVLICELFTDNAGELRRRLAALEADLRARCAATAYQAITDPAGQNDVWEVRKSGLGLLMSHPGDRQPYAFIEDTAVDPARLPTYIRRLDRILTEEGIEQTGHYAHASVGCLHVRPVLNLKRREDITRMRRIADRVSSLVLELGGTMNGEHGDGIVCSGWLEKMYGPRIIAAFRTIKDAFDPQGVLNPGKIVAPLPMDENLRYGPGFDARQPLTALDFGTYGGMAGLAGMCTGLGQCRQRLVGTMCPSYMATADEVHTTRARANALRAALSNRGLLDGLADPALDEVMDLCLSCKACKTECPTGVDMARLKAEWLAHRNDRLGVPWRSRLVGRPLRWARLASRLPHLSNWLMQSWAVRAGMERVFGLDQRVPPPRFAPTTFRRWFARHRPKSPIGPAPAAGQVVYFVDTWTDYCLPQVGQAAVKVLAALGCEVLVLPTACCGRPLLSKGMLRGARRLAETNVHVLAPYAERGVPIVFTEPSCASMFLDEVPQLVRTQAARRIAETAVTIEQFLASRVAQSRPAFADQRGHILYHGHCHQKALIGTSDALALLQACTHGQAAEIDSGCCGMAGAFGHEVEHYEIARAIGEQRLFPAIRARGDAAIAVSGFSCRHHIRHHTGAAARHVIEYVADALAPTVERP
jgi:FAD/FMN-containing dehydrogenase/Fe-S oxidoreductase